MRDLAVLHLSNADNLGGSARSAYKIHRGVSQLGMDSKMLVRTKVTDDPQVGLINPGWLKQGDRVASEITSWCGLQYVYLPSSESLFRHPWYQAADVIQLYNTHGKFFSLRVLPRMCREKQVVWRLSDMWPMTGHCAYSGTCEKWKSGCRGCPDLKLYPSIKWDTAGWLWRWKRELYTQSKLHIVAPSQWIERAAAESPLLGQFPRTLIHNGIDCDVFRPRDASSCRRLLDIPQAGHGILFLAHSVTDQRKGIGLFAEAIRKLWDNGNRNFFVMLVGDAADRWDGQLPCPVWRHGIIHDDQKLARVYNAANTIVHGATVENLPNSLLEAMACGIPAVAFDAGGVAELVGHQRTGFLARLGDIDELVAGLVWRLSDERSVERSRLCRQTIEAEFSLQGQSSSFAALYEQLMDCPRSTARAA